jgi:hypothetical protein
MVISECFYPGLELELGAKCRAERFEKQADGVRKAHIKLGLRKLLLKRSVPLKINRDSLGPWGRMLWFEYKMSPIDSCVEYLVALFWKILETSNPEVDH